VSQAHPDWEVEFFNASSIAGMLFGDMIYNKILENNLTKLIPLVYLVTSSLQPLVEPGLRERFINHWKTVPEPDVVVSFVPFLNAVICESIPSAVHITILTDFAHSKAHPWLQSRFQNVLVGTDQAQEQAAELGFAQERIIRISGMLVHPRFYSLHTRVELDEFRAMYGLEPKAMTFMIMFGSHPPTEFVEGLVKKLSERTEAANCICMCGKNSDLRERLLLRQRAGELQRTAVIGFTDKIPLFMQMSNVVVGKPGPGVVSEALVSSDPLILLGARGEVMQQELDVLRWVEENRAGIVVTTAEEIAAITASQIKQMTESVRNLTPNRAVFEAVGAMDNILVAGDQRR